MTRLRATLVIAALLTFSALAVRAHEESLEAIESFLHGLVGDGALSEAQHKVIDQFMSQGNLSALDIVSTSARNGRAHHERHASLRQRAARDRRTGGHAGSGISVVFGQRQRNAAGPPRRAAAQPVLRRQFIERHALQRHLGLRRRRPRVCAAGQQLRAAHHRRDESGSAVSRAVHQHVGWRPPSQRPDMAGRRHQSRSGLG